MENQKDINLRKCICYSCELNKISSGCNKSIKDIVVIKGIGAVECKHYKKVL